MVYSYTLIVAVEDLDDLHHVNNLRYIQWILDAAEKHWVSETSKDFRSRIVWVVLSHYVEYKRPAHLTDELSVETWVKNFSAIHCERHTHIKNKATGKILVSAITKWCPISTKTMKPTRITPQMVEPFRR